MAIKQTVIADTNNNQLNSSTEESILILRKIVKLLESNATTDSQQRQKIEISPYDLAAPTYYTGTVLSANNYGASLNGYPTGNNYSTIGVTFGTNVASSNPAYDSRWMLFDMAHQAYSKGIRKGLKCS